MKTQKKIIKLLIEKKKAMTIRELAKEIKSDYRITYLAAQRLIQANILTVETVGKSSLCRLNDSYYGIEIYEAEDERGRNILKNSNLKQLHKEIMRRLNNASFIVLLFGSYAKGKQTKSSDIDLMFISNEKDFEEKVNNILSLIPLKTHLVIFTEEEFIRMKDSRKPNVIKEAIEHNIILYGIESFYRLRCLTTNE